MRIKKISFKFGLIPLLILSNFAFAKEVVGIKAIDFRYEDESASVFSFDKKDSELLDPQEHGDKYILIKAGVETPTFVARRSKIHYLPNFKEDSCIVENLQGQKFSTGSINKVSLEKLKFLRECIKYKVEDPKKAHITFDQPQQNCEIKQVNDYTLILSSGDCFVKAQTGQILDLSFYLEPSCMNRSYYVENGFSPMEMMVDFAAYIYPTGEIGPNFNPVKTLWRKKLFVNMNSAKELLDISASEDEETGKLFFRPTKMAFPDIYVSNLKVRNQQNSGFFDLGLLVSTFGGAKICESGICSSYSNYDVPLAPEIILYEKSNNGKKIELAATGRNGDRFSGQWNGEYIMGDLFFGIPFEKGKKYLMELKFSDPVQDFNRLKKVYRSLLRSGFMTLGTLTAGVDSFGTLSTFSELGGVGNVPVLSTGGGREMFTGISWDLKDPIPSLVATLIDKTFPPNYSEVCNKEMSKCKKANSKEIAKILVEFEVKDVDDNGNVTIGDNIVVERVSELLPYSKYNLDLKNKPTLKCKDL